MKGSLLCVVLLLTLTRFGFAHTVFKSRAEAEAAAKTLTPCN